MTQQSHFWVISKGTENEISQKEFDISHVGNPKEPDSDRVAGTPQTAHVTAGRGCSKGRRLRVAR